MQAPRIISKLPLIMPERLKIYGSVTVSAPIIQAITFIVEVAKLPRANKPMPLCF